MLVLAEVTGFVDNGPGTPFGLACRARYWALGCGVSGILVVAAGTKTGPDKPLVLMLQGVLVGGGYSASCASQVFDGKMDRGGLMHSIDASPRLHASSNVVDWWTSDKEVPKG